MADELADRFAAMRSHVVDWNNEPAYSLFEMEPIPERLIIEFLAAASNPVQGLRLKMRGGALRTNDVTASEMILWRDTSPDTVVIDIDKARTKTKASLRAWNVWRGEFDATQAWLRNAGMRVDIAGEHSVTLRCSDGEGPATFDDLLVRLTFADH